MQGLFPYPLVHNFERKGIPFLDLSLQKETPGTNLVCNTESFTFLNAWSEVNRQYY